MKIILSIILFFFSQASFADGLFYDGWLQFGWKLDLGLMPQYEFGFYHLGGRTSFWTQEKVVIKQNFGLDAKLWGFWRIFTEIDVYDTPIHLFLYNPFRVDFSTGTELRWNMLIFGLRHRCDHPVEGNGLMERNEYHYGGNYTELYVKINGGYGW